MFDAILCLPSFSCTITNIGGAVSSQRILRFASVIAIAASAALYAPEPANAAEPAAAMCDMDALACQAERDWWAQCVPNGIFEPFGFRLCPTWHIWGYDAETCQINALDGGCQYQEFYENHDPCPYPSC